MNKTHIILICLFATTSGFGQQLAQYSQYLHNPILINPATTGINNNVNINLSYRNQWTGFNEAPKTYYLSVDATLFREKNSSSLRMSRPGYTVVRKRSTTLNHGVGGFVIADTYGAFSNTSAYLTYAMHITLSKTIKMSLGLSAGMSHWKLNEDKVTVADPNDETYKYLISQDLSKTFFDLSGGLWVYSDKFYVGYSSAQLLQNQIRSVDVPSDAKINVHHFVTAGYKFQIGENFELTPSIMLKYMNPSPGSFDFNVKVSYQNSVWGGISYRHNDAIVAMVGYELNDRFNIGYSYDITLSGLRSYSSGSHEIVLRAKIFKTAQRSSISFL